MQDPTKLPEKNASSLQRAEWLSQALEGDRDALGRLLIRYRAYLRMLAQAQIHHKLQGKADASDLVQETCLEAHRSIQAFRGSTSDEFSAWLRGILANLLAKHVRHYLGTQQRNIRLEQSLTHELDQASGTLERGLAAGGDSPSQLVMDREAMHDLAEAIEALPEDYRMVILLRNIQSMSFREVAETMNRSVDSVEKLWIRGLRRLKQEMDNRGFKSNDSRS